MPDHLLRTSIRRSSVLVKIRDQLAPPLVSAYDVGDALGHFHRDRAAGRQADVVVFASVPAESPAAAIAAAVDDYARAGATCVAVNATGSDPDLERFVSFLARQVAPLVS